MVYGWLGHRYGLPAEHGAGQVDSPDWRLLGSDSTDECNTLEPA